MQRSTTTPTASNVRELNTWDDVRFALRSQSFEAVHAEDEYSEGSILQDELLRDSLVTLRGDDHFERRRIHSRLFRPEVLTTLEREVVIPRIHQILESLNRGGVRRTARADLCRISEEVFLILMASVVGIDLDSSEKEARFIEIFQELDTGVRVRYAKNPHEVLREGLKAQDQLFREFIEPAWAHRESVKEADETLAQEGDASRGDLITLILNNQEHFEKWDDDIFMREVTLFITASIGTATREISLAFDEIERWLANHPEHQSKRLDEEFLRACFEESLRFHQSVRDVGRVATTDISLPSGIAISAGEVVKLNLTAASQELLGPDGDRFDPYREMPESAENYGLAFGGGRHTCIGKWLVLGDRKEETSERSGIAVSLLGELYSVGMRPDPEREPRLKDTITRRFDSYPIILPDL